MTECDLLSSEPQATLIICTAMAQIAGSGQINKLCNIFKDKNKPKKNGDVIFTWILKSHFTHSAIQALNSV